MSLYDDLTTVLTPYANKIKQNESDIGDIQDTLEHLDVETDTTLTQSGSPADAKVVGDEIATISLSTGYETITPTENNKYIDLSGSSVTMSGGVPQYSGSSATYSCSIYACRENDKFIINGAGGNQTRLWGFISSTGTILGVAQTMASATGLMIVAPKDTAYLITHTSDGRVSFKEGWVNINSKVNNLNANVGRYGVYTLSESDIEQGDTSDGKRVYSATSLRTGISISVKAGDVIRFTGGTTITDASITRYDTNGSFVTTGGYASSHNYKIPADGFVLINYKNSANASITPSQYDATTQVISERGIALESCKDGVLSAKVKMILTSDNDIEVVNNGASLQLIGTGCYVLGLKTGARKLVTYADIANQVPTYCTTNDRGLLIAMPNNGVFGYDIENEQFVMKTGEVGAYVISDSFTPLYYRYYNTVFGDLVDRYIYKKVIALESCKDGVLSAKVKMILTSDNDIEVVNNGASLQLIGTGCYVLGLKTGARKLVTYADIANQVPTYCTTNDRGLLIAMPNNGVFGYDIENEQFVMKTGEVGAYVISDSFTPLYYRYYNTVFGDLVDRYIYKKVINTVESKTIVRQSFNSAYHEGATDFATKCSQFCFLMYGDGVVDVDAPTDIEPFLFFTDPHLAMFSGWENAFCEKLACIQKYYNSTPTSFCLCGGDWLGTSDLPSEACFKMGYIDGVMRSMFDNSYMLVGNHDTNYIGKLTPESGQYTTSLSNECIANLWYRKNRKAYFKFDGDATAFYCFDTGVEAQQLSSQNNYGYTQLEWFANSLLTEEKPHIAVTAHILFYNNEQALQPLTNQVLSIAQAYNSRGSISVNNVLYDFGTVTGKIEFGLFGHTHSDYNGVIKGIPCIITTNVMRTISPTFDLILADYTNRVLHMVRVGEGSDRNISLS